ncbi:MAG: hypothetical protein ACI9G1_002376, partial [Pirellulaceae bacterium]
MKLGRLSSIVGNAVRVLRDALLHRDATQTAVDISILEDRILYSASPLIQFAEVMQDVDAEFDQVDQIEQDPKTNLLRGLSAADSFDSTASIADLSYLMSGNSEGLLSYSESAESFFDGDLSADYLEDAMSVNPVVEEPVRREIVFIDRSVDDYQQLVDGLREAVYIEIETVFLDDQSDGIAQISAALAERTDLVGIHIISHGNSAGIQLGNLWLSSSTLNSHAEEVSGWRDSLSDSADLLFYGCDLAQSSEGRELLREISALCDCDVAASSDDTGAESLGGDWDLEFILGDIETEVVLNEAMQQTWLGLLEASTPGIAIWRENGSSSPEYELWNGVAFEPEQLAANVAEWRIIEGAEAPTRDEIILVGVDASGTIEGQMWDGSAWSALPFALATVTSSTDWGFDVAYESQSGDAILAWNNGTTGTNNVSYRVWDGATWSAELSFASPLAGEATQVRMASAADTDVLTMIVTNADSHDYAAIWTGSSWSSTQLLGTATAGESSDSDAIFESQSGEFLIVYDDTLAATDLQYYSGSFAGFGTNGTLAAPVGVTGDPVFVTLAADINSDNVAVAVTTTANEVWFAQWDGNTWGDEVLVTSTFSTNNAQ